MDGAVLLGDDVPAWLRFPGSSSDFRVEQVGCRHALGRPNQLLFLLGQIACETVDAFRKQPDTSVRNFDVREDVRLREVRLLCLRCLVGVRSERGDVDQPRNPVVGSGASDDASAVRVTDKNRRATDPSQRASYGGDVVRCCVEPRTGRLWFDLLLEGGNHLLKHEPSAQSPWQKTMLGLVWLNFDVIASSPLSFYLYFLSTSASMRRRFTRPMLQPPETGEATWGHRSCWCRNSLVRPLASAAAAAS